MINSPRVVSVYVGDLDIARQWYGQAFEREPSYVNTDGVSFLVDNCWLSLRLGTPAQVPRPAVYWAVDDLPAVFNRLRAMGQAAPDNALQLLDTEQQTAHVLDPFGNVLGLMAIDATRERKSRNQRAAERVALQNVRETLDGLQQADAEQRTLGRTVGWVVGLVILFLVVAAMAWLVTSRRTPEPPRLQIKLSSSAPQRQ